MNTNNILFIRFYCMERMIKILRNNCIEKIMSVKRKNKLRKRENKVGNSIA